MWMMMMMWMMSSAVLRRLLQHHPPSPWWIITLVDHHPPITTRLTRYITPGNPGAVRPAAARPLWGRRGPRRPLRCTDVTPTRAHTHTHTPRRRRGACVPLTSPPPRARDGRRAGRRARTVLKTSNKSEQNTTKKSVYQYRVPLTNPYDPELQSPPGPPAGAAPRSAAAGGREE